MRGSRLIDIVMDKQEDLLYEDTHSMRLTFDQMANRCLQAELTGISVSYTHLTLPTSDLV